MTRSEPASFRTSWKLSTIREITEGVYDGPHATPDPSESGPVFLGIKNITEDGHLDLTGVRHISEEEFPRWTKRVLPRKDDIVFSYEATLNRYALIPDGLRCCLGRRMALVRVDRKKVDPHFLYHYFMSEEWRNVVKKNTIVGATVDRLPIADFPDFPVRLPDLDEQKRIAAVLSALDAKITLNQRINAELEAMAKLVYDYWFVQFDFPNAKGKPYKSSGGRMVYNAELKREVPEGWEVDELGKHLTIERGISYSSSDIGTSGTPLVNLDSFTLDGRYKLEGIKYFTGKVKAEKLLEPGDLMIATTDVTRNAHIIGRAFILPDIFTSHAAASTDIAKVNVGPKLNKYMLQMLFNTEHFHKYIKGFASGTLVLHLNTDGLKWYKTPIPPSELQDAYQGIKEPIERKAALIMRENQELTALRDWLLPLLMNGQVRVSTSLDVTPAKGKLGLALAAEPVATYGKSAPKKLSPKDRAALNGWIIHVSLRDKFLGRTKAEKLEHILEGHLGNDHQREPVRFRAGPLDKKGRELAEQEMQARQWGVVLEKELPSGDKIYPYRAGTRIKEAVAHAEEFLGRQLDEAKRVVVLMRSLNTHQCEVLATLYAAWNDLLHFRKPITDKGIITEASFEWDESKLDIEHEDWEWGLKWLRDNDLVPTGRAKLVRPK